MYAALTQVINMGYIFYYSEFSKVKCKEIYWVFWLITQRIGFWFQLYVTHPLTRPKRNNLLIKSCKYLVNFNQNKVHLKLINNSSCVKHILRVKSHKDLHYNI